MDAEKFASFLASSTPADVISSLDGFYVEKGMTVGDIMSDNLFTIRKEETLKDLADLFYKHRISYVPVVDGQDRLIGEVSMSDLLKVERSRTMP